MLLVRFEPAPLLVPYVIIICKKALRSNAIGLLKIRQTFYLTKQKTNYGNTTHNDRLTNALKWDDTMVQILMWREKESNGFDAFFTTRRFCRLSSVTFTKNRNGLSRLVYATTTLYHEPQAHGGASDSRMDSLIRKVKAPSY